MDDFNDPVEHLLNIKASILRAEHLLSLGDLDQLVKELEDIRSEAKMAEIKTQEMKLRRTKNAAE